MKKSPAVPPTLVVATTRLLYCSRPGVKLLCSDMPLFSLCFVWTVPIDAWLNGVQCTHSTECPSAIVLLEQNGHMAFHDAHNPVPVCLFSTAGSWTCARASVQTDNKSLVL